MQAYRSFFFAKNVAICEINWIYVLFIRLGENGQFLRYMGQKKSTLVEESAGVGNAASTSHELSIHQAEL
jgi:hypothetical protein